MHVVCMWSTVDMHVTCMWLVYLIPNLLMLGLLPQGWVHHSSGSYRWHLLHHQCRKSTLPWTRTHCILHPHIYWGIYPELDFIVKYEEKSFSMKAKSGGWGWILRITIDIWNFLSSLYTGTHTHTHTHRWISHTGQLRMHLRWQSENWTRVTTLGRRLCWGKD